MEGMKRIEETILFVINTVDSPKQLGTTKLNKICWKSDVEYYLMHRKSITGAAYKKQPYGPVMAEMMHVKDRLMAAGKVKYIEVQQGFHEVHSLIPLKEADESIFSSNELMILYKNTMDIFHNHTAQSISEESHDIIWSSCSIGEEIPLYAYLAGRKANIEEADIEWAKGAIQNAS